VLAGFGSDSALAVFCGREASTLVVATLPSVPFASVVENLLAGVALCPRFALAVAGSDRAFDLSLSLLEVKLNRLSSAPPVVDAAATCAGFGSGAAKLNRFPNAQSGRRFGQSKATKRAPGLHCEEDACGR